MKIPSPGAEVLSSAVRSALAGTAEDDLVAMGAMAPSEVAQALVAIFDARFLEQFGHRAPPHFLRNFADQAEAQARMIREIAAQREGEAS